MNAIVPTTSFGRSMSSRAAETLADLCPRFVEFDLLCEDVPEFSIFNKDLYYDIGILLKRDEKTIIDLDRLLESVRSSALRETESTRKAVLPLLRFLLMQKIIRNAKEEYGIDERLPIEYQVLLVAQNYITEIYEKEYNRKQAITIGEDILHFARNISDFNNSFSLIYLNTLRDIIDAYPNEFEYQRLFKKVGTMLCGGEICKFPRENNRHCPDAWIKKGGEYIPVEVKLGCFNKSALRQLQRYINVYGCKNGIAVGKECTEQLDDNIQFISLTQLEECGWKDIYFEEEAEAA